MTVAVSTSAVTPKATLRKQTGSARKHSLLFSPPFLQFAADFLTFLLSYALYFLIRIESGWFANRLQPGWDEAILAGLALSVFWHLFFWIAGLYRNWYVRSPFEEIASIFKTTFVGCMLLFVTIFLDDLSRSSATSAALNSRFVLLIYWAMLVIFVSLGRIGSRILQRKLRTRGIVVYPTVLIGTPKEVASFSQSLERAPALGYRPIGAIVTEYPAQPEQFPLPILGTVSEVRTLLQQERPSVAIITMEHGHSESLLEMVHTAQEFGIAVKIVPNLYEVFSGQVRTMQIYGTPLIEISSHLMKPWEMAAKRLLDITVSAAILVGGLPLWLLIALLIKLDSPGPIFYVQERVGKGGKIFRMYKFRSMVVNAESQGPQWAQANDPRVTRIGRWLRKTHLDEIPQFWNILKGDMSLVGPRPERPHFVEKYSKLIPYYKRRLVVRQGLTGWNQIKRTDYEQETLEIIRERLRHDFFYIENMSFKLDLEILIRTVFIMLRGKGTA